MATPTSRTPPTLRDAARGDLPAINDIYNHYVRTSTSTYQTQPSTAEDRAAWFGLHGGRHPVIVAEAEGRVVGWGSLSPFHPRDAYRHTVEDSVYVRHDFQRRGAGGAILSELIRRALALEHRTVVALISADQPVSVALHARLGFVEAGRLREVGRKFDRWLDVTYMQLLL